MCRGIHKISRSAQPLLDSLSPAGATKVLLILWRMASDHVAMIPRVRIIGPFFLIASKPFKPRFLGPVPLFGTHRLESHSLWRHGMEWRCAPGCPRRSPRGDLCCGDLVLRVLFAMLLSWPLRGASTLRFSAHTENIRK